LIVLNLDTVPEILRIHLKLMVPVVCNHHEALQVRLYVWPSFVFELATCM
jgi:hypothetical protein